MKDHTRTVCILFLASAFPTVLCADTIVDGLDILSQQYDVSLQWTEKQSGFGYSIFSSGGSQSSSPDGSPFSVTGGTPHGSDVGSASVGLFTIHDSGADFDHTFSTDINGNNVMNEGTIVTHAQGQWNFRPTGTSLNLALAISAEYSHYGTTWGGLSAKLTDLTTGVSLLDLESPLQIPVTYDYTYFGNNGYSFSVDPTHVYELDLSAFANDFSADYSDIGLSAAFGSPNPQISTVPERASTVILLGLALAGMVMARGTLCSEGQRTRLRPSTDEGLLSADNSRSRAPC